MTAVRIVLTPLFLWTLWTAGRSPERAAGPSRGLVAGFLALIVLTDLVDGVLARRMGVASRKGAVLDAAADRAVELGALTILVFGPGVTFAPMPYWLLAVVLFRDLVLAGGWWVLRGRGRRDVAEHRWHGRLASGLVLGLLFGVVLGLPRGAVLPLAALAAGGVLASMALYVRRASAVAPDAARGRTVLRRRG